MLAGCSGGNLIHARVVVEEKSDDGMKQYSEPEWKAPKSLIPLSAITEGPQGPQLHLTIKI